MNKVKLTMNVLFSGIGCQERGFENSNLFDIEVVNTSEINKEAVLSYAAIHCGLTNEMVDTYKDYPSRKEMARQLTEINFGYEPEKNKHFDWYKLARRKSNDIEKYWLASKLTNNLGDISKIEFLSYADLWTISSPCQSISIAGKMNGLEKDSGTRSSLVWDSARLLQRAKEDGILPKYLLMENVKNLVSKKFKDQFDMIRDTLDEIGFNTYYKVLNAKDCGVPQNRERVFLIGIRKDIDNGIYDFPKPFDTGIRLKDVLDKEVDEKYYLSEDIQKRFKITDDTFTKNIVGTTKPENSTRFGQRDVVYQENGIIGCLQATDYKQPKQIIEVTNNCMQGGDRQPRVLETPVKLSHSEWKQQMFNKFIEDANGEPSGVNTNQSQTFGYRPPMKGYSRCLRSENNDTGVVENFRVRKLTPSERFKLMGLTEDDILKAKAIRISDSQLYRQAGNGIVTNCVELLAEHLYKSQYDNTYICTDEIFVQMKNFKIPQNLTDCENKLIQVAEIDKPEWRESCRRVYSADGVSPTLHGIGCGGNTEPKIIDEQVCNSR